MMDIYFQEDYLIIYLDEDNSLAKAAWQGFLSSPEFRHGAQTCLDLINNRRLLYWLADNRKMKAIRKQDQEWVVRFVSAGMAQSTLRKMATLVSEDIFNQMAVESMITQASDLVAFDHRYFKDEIPALLWLKQNAPKTDYQL